MLTTFGVLLIIFALSLAFWKDLVQAMIVLALGTIMIQVDQIRDAQKKYIIYNEQAITCIPPEGKDPETAECDRYQEWVWKGKWVEVK